MMQFNTEALTVLWGEDIALPLLFVSTTVASADVLQH